MSEKKQKGEEDLTKYIQKLEDDIVKYNYMMTNGHRTIFSVVGVDKNNKKFNALFDSFTTRELARKYVEYLKGNPGWKDLEFIIYEGGIKDEYTTRSF